MPWAGVRVGEASHQVPSCPITGLSRTTCAGRGRVATCWPGRTGVRKFRNCSGCRQRRFLRGHGPGRRTRQAAWAAERCCAASRRQLWQATCPDAGAQTPCPANGTRRNVGAQTALAEAPPVQAPRVTSVFLHNFPS